MNYICFFHISQKKQLKSIYSKILEFDKEIDANININKTYSIDDIIIENSEIITYIDENNITQQVQTVFDDIPDDDTTGDIINNVEPINEEPINEESIKEAPKKVEPIKEAPIKVEPIKEIQNKRKKMTMGM